MKIKFILFSFLITLFSLSSKAQAWQYAHSFGGQTGSNDFNNNQPHNMEVDNEGNAYVFGTYGALTELNDSTLPFFYDGTRGSFVAKYNCAGEVEWFKAISNSEQKHDQASYMILKDDYLYLSGTVAIDNWFKTWFIDTLVYGSVLYLDFPQNSIYPWVPFNYYTYMIKMDLQGQIVDQHLLMLDNETIESESHFLTSLWYGPSNQRAFNIDNEGNYYMFTKLRPNSSIDLYCDNQMVIDSIVPENNKLHYLLKFDPDFNLIWHKTMIEGVSDPDNEQVIMDFQDMRCDAENNLYVVGYAQTFNNSDTEVLPIYIDLGNGQSIESFGGGYYTLAGFLLKMNSDGEVLWTQQAKQFREESVPSASHFKYLTIDEASNAIYVGGRTQPVTTFVPNAGSIFGESDTIFNDLEWGSTFSGFIAKYDMNGNYKWVTNPLTSQSYISSLDIHNNQIYANLHWTSNFQHGEDIYETNAIGLAICVWDTAGNPVSSINIPSTCQNYTDLVPYDTRVNSRGEITITGTYDYGLTFGEHEIYGEGFKMFIAKYGKACPVVLDEEDEFCYGDIYRDTILTQTGDYQFVIETEVADSVINLYAEVNPELTTGIADTTFCAYDTYYLEANSGYDTYAWSTGSNTSQESLYYEDAGTETILVNLTQGNCSGTDTITITVDICGQVQEQNPELDLKVYPVPAQSFLKVDLPKETQISTYSIYNMQGQKLLQKARNSEGQKLSIGIEDLPAGTYVLYLQGSSQVYRAGFVKK